MLSHYSQVEDGPSVLMSLGPSPAAGAAAPLRSVVHNPKARHFHTPAYLCPVPIKSSSPLPSTSSRRKNRPGLQDKNQRQASEEISHILRRKKENMLTYDLEQQLLDGSRSADMFVAKRHMSSEGVLHFATPPVGGVQEDGEQSDEDDRAMPAEPREESTDFLNLHELRQVMSSPSHPSYIRSASVQDLAVMVDSFTPPDRSQNPLPRSSPFVVSEAVSHEGAELGLLSFSPPNSLLDEDVRARRAQYAKTANLSSDFRNRQRFGEITPRVERTY